MKQGENNMSDTNTQVVALKAEIFDILAAQENLRYQVQQLDEKKQAKLKELQALLTPAAEVPAK